MLRDRKTVTFLDDYTQQVRVFLATRAILEQLGRVPALSAVS